MLASILGKASRSLARRSKTARALPGSRTGAGRQIGENAQTTAGEPPEPRTAITTRPRLAYDEVRAVPPRGSAHMVLWCLWTCTRAGARAECTLGRRLESGCV